MKKTIIALSMLALSGVVLITGCSKDEDTTSPVVTVNGDNPDYGVLKFTYDDPGATASDDEDGNIGVTTSGSVNKDVAGTYVLTYSATDAAGNTGNSPTRTVYVVNLTGLYDATDSIPGNAASIYDDVITVNNTSINFAMFGNYINGAVNGTITGDNELGYDITIPSQIVNAGNPAANRTFQGTGTIKFSKPGANVVRTIKLDYTETTNGQTINGFASYTL